MSQKKLILLVLLATVALLTSAQANLLSNGGFETGDLGDWWVWEADDPNQDYSITGDAAYSGNYGAELYTNSGASIQLGQSPDITEGMDLDVSLMYKAAYSGSWAGAGVAINYYDADWNYLDYSWHEFQSDAQEGPTDWTLVTITTFGEGAEVAPAGTAHIDFRIDQWGWGTHYYDDVSLTPEPATVALLALGGLTLLRRRK